MSNILKKYFSKTNEQLKEEQNNKNNLQNEVNSLKNNYKKQTEEIVTDVWTVAFLNIFPEHSDLIWWINSHKVIAKTLVKNLNESEIKNILKHNLVDWNIKILILSYIFKNKKFKIDKIFFKEIETKTLKFRSENWINSIVSSHYKKWIFFWENFAEIRKVN